METMKLIEYEYIIPVDISGGVHDKYKCKKHHGKSINPMICEVNIAENIYDRIDIPYRNPYIEIPLDFHGVPFVYHVSIGVN